MRLFILGFAFVGVFLGLCETTSAQRTGICRPVSERARIGDVGCWIIAHGFMGELTQPQIFWHLDTYPTRSAAEAAKGIDGRKLGAFYHGRNVAANVCPLPVLHHGVDVMVRQAVHAPRAMVLEAATQHPHAVGR
jgi:hypothetical protein